jgi:putative lipoprotein
MRMLLVCLASLAAAACAPQGAAEPASQDPGAQVTGTVNSQDPGVVLPPDAIIGLRLDDVSRADAPSDLLAEVEIEAAGRQLPIPFRISYDPRQILPAHTYTVSARITSEGRLIMLSTRSYPVLTRGSPGTVDLIVDPLQFRADDAAARPQAPLERTTWLVVEISGRPVVVPADQSATLMLVPTDRRFAASAGCNRLMGNYDLKGGSLRFSKVAGTRMACPPALMAQEQALIEALGHTTGFRASGNNLELMDGDAALARLEAADPP